MTEKLLQNLSNCNDIRFDEKHVKMAKIAYFSQSNIFGVQSERKVAGGYVDIELFICPNNLNTHHHFSIELKYLKREQENMLADTMQEAKEQIFKLLPKRYAFAKQKNAQFACGG